jgi:hypothetical protein
MVLSVLEYVPIIIRKLQSRNAGLKNKGLWTCDIENYDSLREPIEVAPNNLNHAKSKTCLN